MEEITENVMILNTPGDRKNTSPEPWPRFSPMAANNRTGLTAFGIMLMVSGALGTALSIYHLQSARREFVAQFHYRPVEFCATRENYQKDDVLRQRAEQLISERIVRDPAHRLEYIKLFNKWLMRQ